MKLLHTFIRNSKKVLYFVIYTFMICVMNYYGVKIRDVFCVRVIFFVAFIIFTHVAGSIRENQCVN